MARAGRGKREGGRGSRAAGGISRPRKSAADKCAEDSADELLKLNDTDEESDGGAEDTDNEHEVMAFKPRQKDEQQIAKAHDARDEAAPRSGAMTQGWYKDDFYGGDDPGDDSPDESEEEMILGEARRLEELRAARLAGKQDALADLLRPLDAEQEEEAAAEKRKGGDKSAAAAGATATGSFEAVFAAKAERTKLPRDMSQLPEQMRRGMVKSEAPEMMPLLEDFRDKLADLRKLLPVLAPSALAQLPSSGASFVRTKASLLLSTLANLSYYVLLRAEGGDVRHHPVVSQLVWLRQLHDMITPLDRKLGTKLRRLARDAKHLCAATANIPSAKGTQGAARQQKASVSPEVPRKLDVKRRPSLRERVMQQRQAAPGANAQTTRSPGELSTQDLLRLPTTRTRGRAAFRGQELRDLAEEDPSLGKLLPQTSLNEQLSKLGQYLREREVQALPQRADQDVAPKERRRSTRQMASAEEVEPPDTAVVAAPEDADEPRMIQLARQKAKEKKEQRAARDAAAREKRVQQQFRPEKALEGRRPTSKKILQNRGLVRQRKKTSGNARVSHRAKFEKMVKRRRGAVQDMREGKADGTYEGELTGIKRNLKKSTKLG